MREGAGAADDATEGLVGGAGVDESAVVNDVAGVVPCSEAACGSDLDRSGVDPRVARVGVVAAEGQDSRPVFREATRVG